MADAVENNEIRHVGVKPAIDQDSIRVFKKIPDNATQVVSSGNIDNGTSDYYTVTAGKNLYLCTMSVSFYNDNANAANGFFYIMTAVPAAWYRFFNVMALEHVGLSDQVTFDPPMVVPAGYIFRLYSSLANALIFGSLYGYEI